MSETTKYISNYFYYLWYKYLPNEKKTVMLMLGLGLFTGSYAQRPAYTPVPGTYVYPKSYIGVETVNPWDNYSFVSENPWIEPPFNSQAAFDNARSYVISRSDTPDANWTYWCDMKLELGYYPFSVYYFRWPWKRLNFSQHFEYYMSNSSYN